MANTIRRPEDYGALGDGKSDDLGAFIKMLAVDQPNDMIHLSGKTYRLNGTLHVNKSLVWRGEPAPNRFQSLDGTVANAELAIAQDCTAKQSAGGRRDSFFGNTYLNCYPNNNMAL